MPGETRRRLRVVMLGDAELFEPLMAELLADLGVEVEPSVGGAPDLVFALVRAADLLRVCDAALSRCSGAPIIAVLPMRDDRLVQQALAAGVTHVCSLDAPLDALRSTFSAAVTFSGSSAPR